MAVFVVVIVTTCTVGAVSSGITQDTATTTTKRGPCENSDEFRWKNKPNRDCTNWVSRKPNVRCSKVDPFTHKKVKLYCPRVCKSKCQPSSSACTTRTKCADCLNSSFPHHCAWKMVTNPDGTSANGKGKCLPKQKCLPGVKTTTRKVVTCGKGLSTTRRQQVPRKVWQQTNKNRCARTKAKVKRVVTALREEIAQQQDSTNTKPLIKPDYDEINKALCQKQSRLGCGACTGTNIKVLNEDGSGGPASTTCKWFPAVNDNNIAGSTPLPNTTTDELLEFQTKDWGRGSHSGIHSRDPEHHVFRSAPAFEEFWTRHLQDTFPPKGVPEIDFTTNMIIAVMSGEQTTGGYGIEIVAITHHTTEADDESDSAITVWMKTTAPGAEDFVTLALTQPFNFVILKTLPTENVRFTTDTTDPIRDVPRIGDGYCASQCVEEEDCVNELTTSCPNLPSLDDFDTEQDYLDEINSDSCRTKNNCSACTQTPLQLPKGVAQKVEPTCTWFPPSDMEMELDVLNDGNSKKCANDGYCGIQCKKGNTNNSDCPGGGVTGGENVCAIPKSDAGFYEYFNPNGNPPITDTYTGNDVKIKLLTTYPGLNVDIIEEGSFFTEDYRLDRVRIFVKTNNINNKDGTLVDRKDDDRCGRNLVATPKIG